MRRAGALAPRASPPFGGAQQPLRHVRHVTGGGEVATAVDPSEAPGANRVDLYLVGVRSFAAMGHYDDARMTLDAMAALPDGKVRAAVERIALEQEAEGPDAAIAAAEASGLDVGLTIDVLSGTAAGQGHFTTTYPAKALAGDLEPNFMLQLAHKDLALAIDLGAKLGADSLLGPVALEVYRTAMEEGRGPQDWTAIYPFTRERSGLEED